MKKHHARRHRRSAKMKLRSGGKFKVGHKRKGGRTGSSKPGRTFRDRALYVQPVKAKRPWAFIFGDWACCDKVLDAIAEQERLESIGRSKMTAPPDMELEERRALARVFDACKVECKKARDRCSGHERDVFDAWVRSDPVFRQSLKAVLTDLFTGDIGRNHPRRKAWGARPMGMAR
jgi:hypothetical protein